MGTGPRTALLAFEGVVVLFFPWHVIRHSPGDEVQLGGAQEMVEARVVIKTGNRDSCLTIDLRTLM